MTNHWTVQEGPSLQATTVKPAARSMLGRFAEQFSDSPVSFDITLPDGSVQPFGPAQASFSVMIRNRRGLRATASIDEGRIGDAYVAGDIEIEGDMLQPFHRREQM